MGRRGDSTGSLAWHHGASLVQGRPEPIVVLLQSCLMASAAGSVLQHQDWTVHAMTTLDTVTAVSAVATL
jgi:hypothetical protein